MTLAQKKALQKALNTFTKKYLRGVKPLRVDGVLGYETRVRIETVKWYLGYGKTRHAPTSKVSGKFLRALASPKSASLGARVLAAGAKRRVAQRRRHRKPQRWNSAYSGCRTVTNEIVAIVGGRAPVTSRKRWQTFGNPGSDHYAGNTRADAVDFGTANNHRLKNEVASKLTKGAVTSVADYGNFTVTRNGARFRVQGIAGTHGTGPHLHYGVRRI